MNKLLTLSAAVAVLLVVAVPAEAKLKRCAKSGDKVVQRSGNSSILTRRNRDKKYWPNGAVDYYACSRQFGRRVPIGTSGTSVNGPEEITRTSVAGRYAVTVSGSSNNAGSSADEILELFDLKTGKSRSFDTEPDVDDTYVTALLVDPSGAVGWNVLHQGSSGNLVKVFLLGRSTPRVVAEGLDIVPDILRFDSSEGKLHLKWFKTAGMAPVD